MTLNRSWRFESSRAHCEAPASRAFPPPIQAPRLPIWPLAYTPCDYDTAEKGEAAAAEIQATTGRAKPSVRALDLANLDSVRAFAGEFAGDRVDLLVKGKISGRLAVGCPEGKEALLPPVGKAPASCVPPGPCPWPLAEGACNRSRSRFSLRACA